MLILNPGELVVGMLIDDLKEHPKGWLKFLFIESPIGWVIVGVVSLEAFFVVSTILYWVGRL